MRIENQPQVHTLANSSVNQSARPGAPQPETTFNAHPAASQNTQQQDREIQEQQDVRNEVVKNQFYDSSGKTNRLPGTVTLFDTTA